MRVVAEHEYAHVFGGLAKQDPQVLPTVPVVDTPLPSGDGWVFDLWFDSLQHDYEMQGDAYQNGGGHVGDSGSNDSSSGDDSQEASDAVVEKEMQNMMDAVAAELAAGVYAGAVESELSAFVDAASAGGQILQATYSVMLHDIKSYENIAFYGSHVVSPEGAAFEVRMIDWSAYDEGRTATPQQTLMNMVESLQAGNKLAIDNDWSK